MDFTKCLCRGVLLQNAVRITKTIRSCTGILPTSGNRLSSQIAAEIILLLPHGVWWILMMCEYLWVVSAVLSNMLQKPETNTPDQCYKRGENAATKCDPTTKCLRAVPELSEYCPIFGAYKMPDQLYGISISDYQNYGSLQNAGDQGYDLLQNHSPWSLCTGPRLTYFVAVIPTGMLGGCSQHRAWRRRSAS